MFNRKISRRELETRALSMRHAVDQIESALMGFDELCNQFPKWEGAGPDVRVKLNISVAQLRRIDRALALCNDVVNSPDFTPTALGYKAPKVSKEKRT